jgi:hypothetical protein
MSGDFFGLFWGEQQPFVSSGYGGLYFFGVIPGSLARPILVGRGSLTSLRRRRSRRCVLSQRFVTPQPVPSRGHLVRQRINRPARPPILAPKPNHAATLSPAARHVDRPNKISQRHHNRFFANTIVHSGASPHQKSATDIRAEIFALPPAPSNLYLAGK